MKKLSIILFIFIIIITPILFSSCGSNEIDLSTLKWEDGLDQYFNISWGAASQNSTGKQIVFSVPVTIKQIKNGKIKNVEFNIPYNEVEGLTVSTPNSVKMGVDGTAEFSFTVSGELKGDDFPNITVSDITATGTFIPED